MMRGHDKSHGMSCPMKQEAPGSCSVESLHMFQQIETSGKRMLQTNRDDIEIMGIPLQCNKEMVGILCACRSTDEGRMLHRAGALLEEIANRISFEIQSQFEINNLSQELSDRYEELNVIYNIGTMLGNIETSEKAIKFIAEQAKTAFETDAVVVSIPGKGILDIVSGSSSGVPFDIHDKSVIATINEIIIKRSPTGDSHPLYIATDGACEAKFPAKHLNVSLEILAVPIKLKSYRAGFLSLINFGIKNAFETGDMRLLTSLSEQISIVITNAELFLNLEDFLFNVIKALVLSIEAKDSYTRGHSERVSALAMMIADAMDLSQSEKDRLKLASILHDIGKIGISEKILNKEGTLTQEEYSHIKEHPDKGYRILKPIDQLNESLSAIRHHHERYDGTGYPSGLKGKEIPLHARMIAIADTYDAMTSTRSYRGAFSHEDALAEITGVKGKQLDPELVEIFIKLSESFSSL